MILQYDYLFDLVKFYIYKAENNPEFMENDKTFKMGIAAIASMASTVVHRGS